MSDEGRVRDLGEFGLIAALHAALPESVQGGVDLGIGDDAAVWRPTPGVPCVVTTDTLVDGIHFRLDWTDWRSLGHKALAVNLSDCAAMGARPTLATVSLALTGDERVADLCEMYDGMGALAAAHGVAVAGGDVVRSPRALVLTVTVLGECHDGPPLRRDGARPGELIAVSGTLGAAAAGLRLLAGGGRGRAAATADLLAAAHLRPQPRVALGRTLAAHRASAAMDLSDGLSGDLPKLLQASGVAGRIELARLPVVAAVRALFRDDWRELALHGGEDYELLFTLPPERLAAIVDAADEVDSMVTVIGRVEVGDGSLVAVELDGRERRVTPGAFDHFSTPGPAAPLP